MSNKLITSLWECECSSKNPLRLRKCKSCGREIPYHYLSQIYYEELKAQKAFVLSEDFETSRKRCLKIGNSLEKMRSVVVPIMLAVLVVCNIGRIYFDNTNIEDALFNNLICREERLWNEVEIVQGRLTGLKKAPVVIETAISAIISSFEDVSTGIIESQIGSNKHIEYKKIEQTIDKIEGVIEYATDKLR